MLRPINVCMRMYSTCVGECLPYSTTGVRIDSRDGGI